MKLEGTGNIFAFEVKFNAFVSKIDLWICKIEGDNFSVFDTLKPIIDEQCAEIKGEIQKTLHSTHKNEFNRYFPDCNDEGIRKLTRNPFIVKISDEPDEI